jgi:hypothetical protein
MNGVLRAAAPEDVPPGSDQIFIRLDTRDADIAERFMARAIGKPFLGAAERPAFTSQGRSVSSRAFPD